MKVELKDKTLLGRDWDTLQWTGENAEDVFTFLIQMPDWNMTVDGETGSLHIRRDFDEHSSREWILDVFDWIVISPFDSLHVFSPDQYLEAFDV